MPMPDERGSAMRTVSAREAALGRRPYLPWECGGCAAVLPFPRQAEIACPRCGHAPGAPRMPVRLAARLEEAAAAASDQDTETWLRRTATAWRRLP